MTNEGLGGGDGARILSSAMDVNSLSFFFCVYVRVAYGYSAAAEKLFQRKTTILRKDFALFAFLLYDFPAAALFNFDFRSSRLANKKQYTVKQNTGNKSRC